MILPLTSPTLILHAWNKEEGGFGRTQLHLNQRRMEFHKAWARWQDNNSWQTNYASWRHIGHSFTIIMLCFRRLSIIRILPLQPTIPKPQHAQSQKRRKPLRKNHQLIPHKSFYPSPSSGWKLYLKWLTKKRIGPQPMINSCRKWDPRDMVLELG